MPVPLPDRPMERSLGTPYPGRRKAPGVRSELLAAGASNREIRRALFISEATVKTHLAHVYDKLGVDSRTAGQPDSRTAAVRVAVDRRLIRLA